MIVRPRWARRPLGSSWTAGGGAELMDESRRCTATSKQSGERCGRAAIVGGSVCKIHGGGSPQVQAAANRRLVEQEATKELAKVEVRPIGDPIVALGDLAAESLAILEVAKANAAGAEVDSAWMAMLERSMERAGKLLEACGRLGLEERRVRLEEAQLDLAAAVVMGVLRRAGLDPESPQVQDWLEATYTELTA